MRARGVGTRRASGGGRGRRTAAREEDGDACALAQGREMAVDMTPRGGHGRRSSRSTRRRVRRARGRRVLEEDGDNHK